MSVNHKKIIDLSKKITVFTDFKYRIKNLLLLLNSFSHFQQQLEYNTNSRKTIISIAF